MQPTRAQEFKAALHQGESEKNNDAECDIVHGHSTTAYARRAGLQKMLPYGNQVVFLLFLLGPAWPVELDEPRGIAFGGALDLGMAPSNEAFDGLRTPCN